MQTDYGVSTFLDTYLDTDESFILACSGGVDSMFLLHQIIQTPYVKNMIVAHFNHNTRPECMDEESYLQNFCSENNISFEVATCDFEKIQSLYPSKSFEELAREKRYQFFDALMHIHNAKKVLTAHHLDDRIETMLFHMSRGTKLSGLTNMRAVSGNLLRPLLDIPKSEIYSYMDSNNHKYFEDSSNTDTKHTRNFIRHEIIPKLEQVHPESKKNIANLLEYFEELQDHLDGEVNNFLGDKNSFSLSEFFTLSPLLQKEVIRSIYCISNNGSTIGLSEANIAEVLKFFRGKNNKTKKEIRAMNLFKDGDTIFY